ncbi:questin oxidase family protein [Nocardioides sp. CFH 31398]|uniref:questin oxidase family protein n=1 Tax=Nocardioides sp. CFH 31398 TaxID=2919579 RepID=UPI001F053042|nr:questin oxidase family protein [Nocardioides sp. CFH 31398]MCH1867982.1 questin oxidase family protein [Nocardioides sp. CFH 31398]
MSDNGVLREAYGRFGRTGPEFDGWLSNHGPMAVEAMVRHGHDAAVDRWIDRYQARLEPAPSPRDRIQVEEWREALGDPRRLGDWPVFFTERLREADWRTVLADWWPRLLPGIAAGATHGVIRVGHVVRVIEEQGASGEHVAELARALGYWAARWQPVPRVPLTGRLGPANGLRGVPGLPPEHQAGGITLRLARLEGLPGWAEAQGSVAAPTTERAADFLRSLVASAVQDYAERAHGSPVMLVHAATAPNAVLRTLPSLPPGLWAESAATAWAATAAVRAAYLPTEPAETPAPDAGPEELMDVAVRHGDEHLVKLTDTALDVWSWTGDPAALAAVRRGAALVEPPGR